MTEIESALDELITYHFVKKERADAFFEAMLWEDFRFSTKIKLFQIMAVPDNLKELHEDTFRELLRLPEARNKFAHRLSLTDGHKTWLIGKNHKPEEINDVFFDDFKKRCIHTLASLKCIYFTLQGIPPESFLHTKRIKIKAGKIDTTWPD